MVPVGESSVILPTEVARDPEGFPLVKRWRTIALAHMVQFTDMAGPVSGKRPRKRG
jgi:hypothetical protein